MKVGIIDYRAGNVKSVMNSLNYLGRGEPLVIHEPAQLSGCDKIIFPGVGAFPEARQHLDAAGFTEALEEEVIGKKKLFLGICLGMQLIMDRSYEFGETPGFGWVPGEVLPFEEKIDLSVPHMGWNDTWFTRPDPLAEGLENGVDFYYLHSYYVHCTDPDSILATCEYGLEFTAALHRDNIFAVQFHPEKSQNCGLAILNSFLGI